MHLFRHTSGAVNWENLFVDRATDAAESAEPWRLETGLKDLRLSLEIKSAKVSYHDALTSDRPLEFNDISLQATQSDLADSGRQ